VRQRVNRLVVVAAPFAIIAAVLITDGLKW
jgi:hypothetical protein